jgi:hypothetical protein
LLRQKKLGSAPDFLRSWQYAFSAYCFFLAVLLPEKRSAHHWGFFLWGLVMQFTKPPKFFDEQIDLLIERGMVWL